MTSPEMNRTGGPRSAGAGVKGRIAMFEKSTSSAPVSPAPGNYISSNPASRDQSPAPRPLGKVRTSFVTVTANNGGMIGLHKVPVSPSVTSPISAFPEGQKLSGKALEALGKEQAVIDRKAETAESINRMKMPDDSSVKKDLESTNGASTLPKGETVVPAGLLPAFGEPMKREETTPEELLGPVPVSREKEGGQAKPAKEELKSKLVVANAVPRSPTKLTPSTSKVTKPAVAIKPGKNHSIPLLESNAAPQSSPAFPPKSPVRSAASSSSASRTNPVLATSLTSTSTRTRIGISTSTTATTPSAAPKTRPTTTAAKTKAQKLELTKPAREPMKPPTIRSSAFAPTTASAAKLAADQKKAVMARSRPPSAASIRNRSPPDGSIAMRRENSGPGSSRPERKEQRPPQRPQTSAAIRSLNRSSVGSLASVSSAGGDFLSRMMRPTTASAGKVSDKKPPVGTPSGRSASVASTSRRREPSLPPPTKRLQMQRTGEKKLAAATTGKVVPEVQEPVGGSQESKVGGTPPISVEVVSDQAPIIEVPVAAENEAETNEEDDGGQSPSTTTSSYTLVQEGDGKSSDEEPARLAKE